MKTTKELVRNQQEAAERKRNRVIRNKLNKDRADICSWSRFESGSDIFSTACSKEFILNEGTPKENGFVFCPFCGGKLI